MIATETPAEVETSRLSMVWPKALKEAVQEKNGPRGLTDFTIAAVERHLVDADPIADSSKEVGELRYLCQLLADRVAMGGSDDDRREALMELELHDWLETTGWPHEMAALVRPTPAAPVAAAPEVQTPVEINQEAGPAAEGERDDLFARLARKTGQPLDPGFADLKVASDLPTPAPKVEDDAEHNHAWERTDGVLCCACGAWIDDTDPAYPQGIVRDAGWSRPEASSAMGAPVDDVDADLGTPAPLTDAPVATNVCPKCGDELVGGECWTCA